MVGNSQTRADTDTLIRSLQNPRIYDHEVREVGVIETHISWVLLAGSYAYKIKKPVNLGFLDFSTLEKRHFYCQQELRLNRRLAPRLYLDVVAITGSAERPRLHGPGSAIEFAVKMLQFPQQTQLDRVLARGELYPQHIDALASTVAAFHTTVATAEPGSPYGDPEQIHETVLANFDRVLSGLRDQQDSERLFALRRWAQQEYARCCPILAMRKQRGFVRECHGDMHLRNMALLDGEVLVFDCIEFSDDLRWIDVISEIAFVVMDLDDRQCPQLGRRFLNAYLEHTGDYGGLEILRYYLMYRAMVRAMVDRIRVQQSDIDEAEKGRVLAEYRSYLTLAEQYTEAVHPALIITHGLSGSGKTTVAQALLEHYPVIRIRSDVERKRLHGLAADARTGSGIDQGLYTAAATERTYSHLRELARVVLRAGYSVIVDATFLKQARRHDFQVLAKELDVPFLILDCEAPEWVLRERVSERERDRIDVSEANLAVLEGQLASREPLTEAERALALIVDTTKAPVGADIASTLRARLNEMTGAAKPRD
jgi:aminoglycoside phosphotransferase family enzyme/gluconate kinase